MVAYNRVRTLISDADRRFFVFANEHSRCGLEICVLSTGSNPFSPRHTYVEQDKGESINDRNDRAIRMVTKWYNEHLAAAYPHAQDAKVFGK